LRVNFILELILQLIRWAGRQARKYQRWWHVAGRPYKLYAAGYLIIFAWILLHALVGNSVWLIPILLFGVALYFWGFLSWSKPVVQNILESWWGKWAFGIVHAFLLIFSLVYARIVVAKALEMPPQYFDVTIGLVALISYVPVSIGFFALVMLALGVLMFLSAFVAKSGSDFIAYSLRPLFGSILWLERSKKRLKSYANKTLLHAFGALVALVLSALLLDGFGWISHYSMPGIRLFAYVADFQPAGRYPGVPCNGRMRLQDNGVVAIGTVAGNDVVFTIHSFDPNADFSRGCIP
jgi:hypothetical protein